MRASKTGRPYPSAETIDIDPAAPWHGVAFRGEGRQLAAGPSRAEINQAPTLSEPTEAVLTFTENGFSVRLMQGAVFSDPDAPDHFDNAKITISVSGGQGVIDLSSGSGYMFSYYYPDTFGPRPINYHLSLVAHRANVGKVTGVGTSDIVITMVSAPISAITAIIDHFYYTNTSDTPDPADRLVTITVTDGSADGGPLTARQTQILRVVPVDDAPVAKDDAFRTDESTAISGNLSFDNGRGLDDPDSPSVSVAAVNGSAAKVGTQFILASGALLTIEADGAFIYDPNDAFDSLPASGSGATNLIRTDRFTYTLAGGTSATATITLTGIDSADVLWGSPANDILLGGVGIDMMRGGPGNDTYYVEDAGDVIVEEPGEGRDRVAALVSYALGAGSEVEILEAITLSETTPLDLAGNEFVNLVIGNAGANLLSGGGGDDVLVALGGSDRLLGGGGADAMHGGAGDDTYYVGEAGDSAIEGAGQGHDRVAALASHTLTAGSEIEILEAITLSETTALALTGNELANVVVGNAGANRIDGGAGNDLLAGLGGADMFAFTTGLGAANIDLIVDFAGGTDTIALDDAMFAGLAAGPLAAGAFAAGAAAADADDRIVYDGATGALYYDADGNGAAAAVHFATLHGAPAVNAVDFVVI
jgi:VCBS repeat-containing protein